MGSLGKRERRLLLALGYAGFATTVSVFYESVIGWIFLLPVAVFVIYEFRRDIGRMFRRVSRPFGPGL